MSTQGAISLILDRIKFVILSEPALYARQLLGDAAKAIEELVTERDAALSKANILTRFNAYLAGELDAALIKLDAATQRHEADREINNKCSAELDKARAKLDHMTKVHAALVEENHQAVAQRGYARRKLELLASAVRTSHDALGKVSALWGTRPIASASLEVWGGGGPGGVAEVRHPQNLPRSVGEADDRRVPRGVPRCDEPRGVCNNCAANIFTNHPHICYKAPK